MIMINYKLKELLENFSGVVGDVIKNMDLDIDEPEKLAVNELIAYMMYLSASAGKIQWSEERNISEYMDMKISPENINKILRDTDIYSTEFEQRVPISLRSVVHADSTLWDNGDRDTCLAEGLLFLYQQIGQELIESDSNVDEAEKSDYKTYINMMTDYIMEHDKFKLDEGVSTGLKKNSGNNYVDAPTKSGVSAPRKK